MTHIILLFVSQFVLVAMLVMQSANNIHGRNVQAALTSIGIGLAQIVSFKLLPDAGAWEIVAWVIAGPLGNVFAQYVKRHDIAKIRALH